MWNSKLHIDLYKPLRQLKSKTYELGFLVAGQQCYSQYTQEMPVCTYSEEIESRMPKGL